MKADAQNRKKQLEILIVDYFRSVYHEFPNGKLKPSESPDFLLDTSQRNTIGIELTRLYFNDFYTRRNGASDNSETGIVSKAREFFELTSSWNLFVKVCFSKETKSIHEKRLLLPVLIANLVTEKISGKNAGSFFSICQTTNLPGEIDCIFLATHPLLKNSVWEVAGISENSKKTIQMIRQLICKKEEKIQLYRKKWLNQYWLIITADSLNNVRNDKLNSLIFSDGNAPQFQKIFLFDLLKARIYQIF